MMLAGMNRLVAICLFHCLRTCHISAYTNDSSVKGSGLRSRYVLLSLRRLSSTHDIQYSLKHFSALKPKLYNATSDSTLFSVNMSKPEDSSASFPSSFGSSHGNECACWYMVLGLARKGAALAGKTDLSIHFRRPSLQKKKER
jgi:hypothetical protein